MVNLVHWFHDFRAAKWRKDFSSEFTGEHEGRKIQLEWRETVVGHVCVGDDPYSHLRCIQMTEMQWRWVKLATKL
jgi:hypothetical protein